MNNPKTWPIYAVAAVIASCLPVHALEVTKARVTPRGTVEVEGIGAFPGAVYWNGVHVTDSDEAGAFRFDTVIPPKPDCTAEVEDDADEVTVSVRRCRMSVAGFYTAPQDVVQVAPGEFGGARSGCRPGDQVVSGQAVVFADDFRMRESGRVVAASAGGEGVESWVYAGQNRGQDPAEVRVAARCAAIKLR